MIPYFQGGEDEASQYTRSSEKKIIPICPFCGRLKKTPITIRNIFASHGFGCSCKDSISVPNKTIFATIEQLYNNGVIKYFQPEYFIGSYPYRYDIYFLSNDKKYLIEMDGGLGHGHKRSNKSFNKYTLEEEIAIDRLKDKIAEENDYHIIRIDAISSTPEYLKTQIINSELSLLFDLSIIDWNRVFEFAYDNLAKIVCDYRNENQDSSLQELCEKFHVSDSSIYRYLNIGIELGWIDQTLKKITNSKKRIITHHAMHHIGKCISVIDLKTKKEECYKSATELQNISKEKYGVFLERHKIIKISSTNQLFDNRYSMKIVNTNYYKNWKSNLNNKEI